MEVSAKKSSTPRSTPQGENTLLGMDEICNYARISSNTVIKYVDEFEFPASKIGGQWVSDKAMIDMWRKKHIRR